MRILAWIYRFSNNSRKVKKSGPLTIEEIERRIDKQKRLNVHENQEGIYEFQCSTGE